MVRDLDYAFAVARIRANERYMLTTSDIETIISSGSVRKAISFLASKKWFSCDETSGIKEITENVLNNTWNLLSESVPDKAELEIFTVQNDFFNLKTALKSSFAHIDAEKLYVYPTSLDITKLNNFYLNGHLDKIKYEYVSAFSEAADALNKTESGQLAEIILDKAALEYMLDKADKSSCSLVKDITNFFVAVCNIKIAVKCINAKKGSSFADKAIVSCNGLDRDKLVRLCDDDFESLIDYLSKTDYKAAAQLIKESPVLFEKWCDDAVVDMAKKSKYDFFGFSPICGYYYGKIAEIKTVKAILSGLDNDLPEDKIRERVRTLYV